MLDMGFSANSALQRAAIVDAVPMWNPPNAQGRAWSWKSIEGSHRGFNAWMEIHGKLRREENGTEKIAELYEVRALGQIPALVQTTPEAEARAVAAAAAAAKALAEQSYEEWEADRIAQEQLDIAAGLISP